MAQLDFINQKHKEEAEKAGALLVRRVAIYCRQSVDKRESLSIEQQEEECRKEITGNDVVMVYKDKGFSGKNTERPAFKKLMNDVKTGIIKKVVVYRLDRFTRSLADFSINYEILKNNDCAFISRAEKFDTSTSAGRAMLSIVAVFAELERETIQQRVKDNYYKILNDTRQWLGGPPPYGFKVVNKRLEKNNQELEVVKYIYDMYYNDNNISIYKIARRLHDENIRTRKNKAFTNTQIQRILKNSIYVEADKKIYNYYKAQGAEIADDINLYNGKKVAYIVNTSKEDKRTKKALEKSILYLLDLEGFISSNMFLSIQKRMEGNKQIGGGNKQGSSWKWLSGLVKCGKCGYAIRVFNPKYSYIGCSGRIILKECNASFKNSIVSIKSIQEKTAAEIQQHIHDIEKSTQKKKAEYEKTQNEILNLENKISQLVKLAGLVDVEQIAKEINENKSKINKLRLQADFFIEDNIKYNDIDFYTLSDEEKQKITQELINRVLVYENGNIKIDWKV